MTKEDFLAKYGDFTLDAAANEDLEVGFHTPEKENEYASAFALSSKLYNHGILQNGLDPNAIDADWLALSESIDLATQVENALADEVFTSDSDMPYRRFVLPNFEYNPDTFLADFAKAIGWTFKETGEITPAHELYAEISVKTIAPEESVFMIEEPHEDYYGNLAAFQAADELMKTNLTNVRRISLYQSWSFNGPMPIFFIGEKGKNLVGMFSIGIHT